MFSSSCFFCNLVLLSLSLSLSLLFLLYFIQLINDYHASFAYLFQMCVNNQITYIRNFITVSVNSDSMNIHCLFLDLDHMFLNWIALNEKKTVLCSLIVCRINERWICWNFYFLALLLCVKMRTSAAVWNKSETIDNSVEWEQLSTRPHLSEAQLAHLGSLTL